MTLAQFLLISSGGAVGSALRYVISEWNGDYRWPLGTFGANVIACLVLGVIASKTAHQASASPLYLFFAVGFCGGLSTFSTFIAELYRYGSSQELQKGLLYLLISLIIGCLAFFLGLRVGKGL